MKDGSKGFSPIQIRRLQKLGINKTDPSDLTEEEVRLVKVITLMYFC